MAEAAPKVVATNRKARYDYFIEETFEAGIVLKGTEVKSLRAGRVQLRDSYARVEGGEVFLHNAHISPYEYGNRWNHEPLRVRKLLMRREQIRRLLGKTKEQGLTLIPLELYFTPRGRAKLALAVARGKKQWDKREAIARREVEREIARAVRERERE